MDETLKLMLQQVLESQSRTEVRLSAIENTLAEKRGERRVAGWVLGLSAGAAGAFFTAIVKHLAGIR